MISLPPIKELPPKTQFLTKMLGIAASTPYPQNNSPARQQMYTNSHLAQKLVVSGMTENFQSTFMDEVLATCTFNITMPTTGKILKIIDRYPASDFGAAVVRNPQDNPETLVIYEDVGTKELGVVRIPRYLSYHTYFGFELVPTEDAKRLIVGNVIEKGTVFFDSPGVTQTKQYTKGVMLNTAFMSHFGTAEDGIVICEDVLPAFRSKRYEVRTIEFGSETFALNVYGNDQEYKILPDIGEKIRDDGLLMALRNYNPKMVAVDLSIRGAQRVDVYDQKVYAKGPGGKVVDIVVTTNYNYEGKGLSNIYNQLEKYITAKRRFNNELIEYYKKVKRPAMTVSRELHSMLVRAMIDREQGKDRLQKVYKKIPVDHFRVDVVVEYEITPNIGFKFTGSSGDKGVICHIAKPEDMPVDKYGRRADIIVAPEGRNNRMNSGGIHELFYNDASWHLRRKVFEMLKIPYFESPTLTDRTSSSKKREDRIRSNVHIRQEWLMQLYQQDKSLVMQVWEFIINYYRMVAPLQAHIYDRHTSPPIQAILANIATIIEDMVYLRMPPDYAVDYLKASQMVKDHIGFERDKVTFRDYNGQTVVSDGPVRIGAFHWMLLEKTADSWSAVSFGKYQMHGFLAPINKSDKYSDPGRPQPICGTGETELRIIVSVCGPRAAAEIADRNNNARSQRALHRAFLTSNEPSNIAQAVNRKEIPFGDHRGIQILMHFLNCGGISLQFEKEQDT